MSENIQNFSPKLDTSTKRSRFPNSLESSIQQEGKQHKVSGESEKVEAVGLEINICKMEDILSHIEKLFDKKMSYLALKEDLKGLHSNKEMQGLVQEFFNCRWRMEP